MARGRAANGSGMQPRLRPDGRWEVRYKAGISGKTGKPVYRSVYGKTSEEVVKKLRETTAAIDAGTYTEPKKMRMNEWLDIWLSEYCSAIKPGTLKTYGDNCKNHIKPALGAIRLCELQPHDVQTFINGLQRGGKGTKPLSAKTVKNIHGTLCKALTEAVRIHYIPSNPANGCILPKVNKVEIRPLEGEQIRQFMEAIKGETFEAIFFVALNTGMRLSEILGLRWSRVDFKKGVIKVDAQLLVKRGKGTERTLDTTKNGKARTFRAAPAVLDKLKAVKQRQLERRLNAGGLWDNALDLVFTDETGHCLAHATVEHHFTRIMQRMGIERRFHDLRHTFATESIGLGVDYKTTSEALGHYSVGFTMDTYAHVTDAMQEDAAARIQRAILERNMGG